MPDPSPELLVDARSGDPRALEQLIEEQQSYIYSLALGLARDPNAAADVMQEACFRLVRALSSYRGEARFTTWLYRLVVNAGIDLSRRRGRSVSLETDPASADHLVVEDPRARPDLMAERSERAVHVQAGLDRLPTAQRLALTLFYFEDLRYEDIASIMGLPLNTVKSHIRRARERLAGELAHLLAAEKGADRG